MKVAIYARVSTKDKGQDVGLQISQLEAYCKRMEWEVYEVYQDAMSGKETETRVNFKRLMVDAKFKHFDIVLVWKLDRFSRTLMDLLSSLERLKAWKVRFISITENIDTDDSTPVGKLMVHLLGALAEFERDLFAERVAAGMARAREKGVVTGRRKLVIDIERVKSLRAGGMEWKHVQKELGASVRTMKRLLRGER